MKRKDFIEHNWKEGDILYAVGYRRHSYFKIPVKVIRLRVKDKPLHGWLYVTTCKKDMNFLEYYGYNLYGNVHCSDLFFTKEEAEKNFAKKFDDFRKNDSERIYEAIVTELRYLDREKNALWGLMRMKAMKK